MTRSDMAHRPEPDTLRLRDVAVFLFCGLAILLVLVVLVPGKVPS